MKKELAGYRNFAASVAREAGRFVLNNRRGIRSLEWHMVTNFKTEVDKASDALIRGRIIERFPDHNIISEEDTPRDRGSEWTWVVDSWDGTIPGTFGMNDWFAVCVGLVRDNAQPVVGAVYAPERRELYTGSLGGGAFLNGKPIRVLDEENINHVQMGVDFGKVDRIAGVKVLEKLLAPDGISCNFAGGCASVPLCLVASSRLHAYLATSLEPEDMTAAVVINREAGARVTNLTGGEWQLGDRSILVANPNLHENILRFLATH